jgi:sugar/nucleoside kinase (ribokinase family)
MRPAGLFVGLTTLDVVQYVQRLPAPDEKPQAVAAWTGAGGPAANAAAAFAALGGRATLVTAIGPGPLARVALDDLAALGVQVVDVAGGDGALAVSAVLVDAGGRRSVVSTNALGFDAARLPDRLPALAAPDVVAIDAHYPGLAAAVLRRAGVAGRPVVLDPGGPKPHLGELMALSDHIVASRSLDPEAAPEAILSSLERHRPLVAAVSCGGDPIRASIAGVRTELAVARADPIDTLGAGDVLHGAYAFHLAAGRAHRAALEAAAALATQSCRRHGPRLSPP